MTKVLLLLLALTSAAQAQTTRTETVCAFDPYTGLRGAEKCVSETFSTPPQLGPPPLSPQEQAEIAARDRAWEAYCRPRIVQGADGVRRYRYARAGCEFGRSAD